MILANNKGFACDLPRCKRSVVCSCGMIAGAPVCKRWDTILHKAYRLLKDELNPKGRLEVAERGEGVVVRKWKVGYLKFLVLDSAEMYFCKIRWRRKLAYCADQKKHILKGDQNWEKNRLS